MLQLQKRLYVSYLEQWMFEEELPENAAAAPHVDGGPVAFLAQQKLRGSVPQCDHLVGVRTLPVLRIVQPG